MEDLKKLVIVDDHEIFRKGLKLQLKRIDFIKVIGEASSGTEFLERLDEWQPDIVFMDINMPGLDGINTTKKALEKYPKMKIIALTTFQEKEFFDNMIHVGAEGYLLKNTNLRELKIALQRIMNGDNYFSHELLMQMTKSLVQNKNEDKRKNDIPSFSAREIEVLNLICKGYSNEEIGNLLCISNRTVEHHKYRLIEKTGTSNTVNLVIYSFKNKLVEKD